MGEPKLTRSKKFPTRWALRFVVSASILGVILWWLPTDQVWDAIQRIPFWLWVFVFGLFLAGHVLAAVKWWLLTAAGSNIALWTALRAHFAGLAANLCLPGVAGGDVIRAGMIFRGSDSKTRVALGSLADRLLDTLALLFLTGLGAVMIFGTRAFASGPLPLVAAFVLLTVVACTLAAVLLPRFARGGLLGKVADTIGEFRQRPGRLIACLVLSTSVQAGFVGLNIALAHASGLDLPNAAWFFAWPLAKLIAIVPVSLAGLGVREATLAALLSPLGAEAARVVAVGLIWQAVLFATGLLGGLMLALTAGPNAAGRGGDTTLTDQLSSQGFAGRER